MKLNADQRLAKRLLREGRSVREVGPYPQRFQPKPSPTKRLVKRGDVLWTAHALQESTYGTATKFVVDTYGKRGLPGH
jgi:hypothetical protein